MADFFVNLPESSSPLPPGDLTLSGNLLFAPDATYSIGGDGDNRPLNVNVAQSIFIAQPTGPAELGLGDAYFDVNSDNSTIFLSSPQGSILVFDTSQLTTVGGDTQATQLTVGSSGAQLLVQPGVGSALAVFSSTTQGFRPPVMTTTQKNAIATPNEGLIVYDLTLHKLCVFTSATWETITSV